MNGNGYIKLHRKIIDWKWHDDPNTLSLFIHLLLMANHVDGEWHGIPIKPGQRITSVAKLTEVTGLTSREIRTGMTRLKSTNEIAIETTSHYTLITIVNWALYQSSESETTNEMTSNSTIKRQTNDKQTTTNKNEKNDKNIYTSLFDQFYGAYPRKVDKKSALNSFIKIAPDSFLFEIMMNALEWFKRSKDWRKDNGQFIPYPSTWLNGRRWEEYPVAAKQIEMGSASENAPEENAEPGNITMDLTSILNEVEGNKDDNTRTAQHKNR